MSDYISREAVLSAIWKTSAEHNAFFPAIMLDAIKAIPAADAREVVLCANCYLHDKCATEDVFKFARLADEHRFCGVGAWKRNSARLGGEISGR